MELESYPKLAELESTAVRHALSTAGFRLDESPAAYSSAWRRAAAREAVNVTPERYALSPRKTRGATRA